MSRCINTDSGWFRWNSLRLTSERLANIILVGHQSSRTMTVPCQVYSFRTHGSVTSTHAAPRQVLNHTRSIHEQPHQVIFNQNVKRIALFCYAECWHCIATRKMICSLPCDFLALHRRRHYILNIFPVMDTEQKSSVSQCPKLELCIPDNNVQKWIKDF